MLGFGEDNIWKLVVTNKTTECEELGHWSREAVALRVRLLCHGESLTSGGFLKWSC